MQGEYSAGYVLYVLMFMGYQSPSLSPSQSPSPFLAMLLLHVPSFQAGCRETPCGLWFLFSASKSQFLAMLLLHVPSFLGRHAGRAPCGPCSSCLDYSVRLWVTDLSLSLSLSVSVSVFEFAQIVLQVYRDKNLRLSLDLRTPSLSNHASISISVLRACRIHTLTSISATLSLSSVNIRNTPAVNKIFVSVISYIGFAPLPYRI